MPMMININPASVLGFITGTCSSLTVKSVIRANVVPPESLVMKGVYMIGGMSIGAAVHEHINGRTQRRYHELMEMLEEAKKEAIARRDADEKAKKTS